MNGSGVDTLTPPFFTIECHLYIAIKSRGQRILANEDPKEPSQEELIQKKLQTFFPQPPRTFGEKLKYFRIKNNLKQEELGKILGVHKVTICRYEKNLTYPSNQIIQKLSRVIKAHKLMKKLSN